MICPTACFLPPEPASPRNAGAATTAKRAITPTTAISSTNEKAQGLKP
jgi:hypothetical protein